MCICEMCWVKRKLLSLLHFLILFCCRSFYLLLMMCEMMWEGVKALCALGALEYFTSLVMICWSPTKCMEHLIEALIFSLPPKLCHLFCLWMFVPVQIKDQIKSVAVNVFLTTRSNHYKTKMNGWPVNWFAS